MRCTIPEILATVPQLPNDIQNALYGLAKAKSDASAAASIASNQKRISKLAETRASKRQRTLTVDDELLPDDDHNSFLQLPNPTQIRACHAAFVERSSNAALARHICVVCSRQLMAAKFEKLSVANIPNRDCLVPKKRHFAHQLTDELLLDHQHIFNEDGVIKGWICPECLCALHAKKLPKLALADRMWIGPIPIEISTLTIPEQNLISLYHPRCYVYKLHPRNLWTTSDSDEATLQTGLVGNVTSFALNIPDVARMLEGKLLPHPPLILASTIAVTLIARGTVPKSWLRKTFRVRRAAVYAALICLKYTTRHPGYKDIEISADALDALPTDDIPLEILASVGQNEDITVAQQEAAGHIDNTVPQETPDEAESVSPPGVCI